MLLVQALQSVIGTVHTKSATSLLHSARPRTPYKAHQNSKTLAPALTNTSSLGNLEELDLNLNINHLPHSRPIGETAKFRSTTTTVTHISHAEIAEMETAWQRDDVSKGRQLSLLATDITLKPGENRFKLQGKVC